MEDSVQNNLNFEEGTQEMDDSESSTHAEVVDFCGETEVVDYPEDTFQSQGVEHILAGKTQLLDDFEDVLENRDENHEGETQVVEEHDCSEHLRSHLVNDCYDRAAIHSDRMILRNEAACEEITQHQCSSGSSQQSFTSVWAASLCASGLTARQAAFFRSDNELCRMDKMSSLEPAANIVREKKESADEGFGTPGTADLALLPAHDNGLAGLSYVDSQEPGDLSQASALGLVDKFLKVNDFGFTNELDHGRCTDPEPDPQSCVKGSLSLAKRVISKDTTRQVGAFDWDDNQEDEGGGGLFSRMKDEICKGKKPGQRNLPRSQKSKYRSTGQIKQKEALSRASNGKKDSTDSDLRLILLSSKESEGTAKASETNMKRNLTNEFNECSDRSPRRGSAEAYTSNNMISVGPDTQIAAEAMEVLFRGEPLAKCDPNDDNKGKGSFECLPGEKRVNNVSPELCCTPKIIKSCLDSVVVTRESSMTMGNCARMKEDEHDEGAPKRSCLDKETSSYTITKSRGHSSSPSIDQKKGPSKVLIQSDSAEKSSKNSTEKKNHHLKNSIPRHKRKRSATSVYTSKVLSSRENSSKSGHHSGEVEDIELDDHDSEVTELSVNAHSLSVDTIWYPRRTRSHRYPSGQAKGPWTLHYSSMFCGQKDSKVNSSRHGRSEILAGTNAGPYNETCAIQASNKSNWENDEYCTFPYGCDDAKAMLDLKPRVRSKQSDLVCLSPGTPNSTFLSRDSRRRREMTAVRVLFSRHLDEDIIKQQKKILSRLGASVASSMSDATHFIADEFTRTKNMLEAIVFFKPVVTHLWLESCNQTNCFIDEKSYILRDEKKEKEFGFSMPVSLARSWKNPLLQNQRVLVTENVKPGKEIICSLVKAANGQIVERTGRPTLKEIVIPDDLLVLSCEDDYAICEHFLDKGVPVYSSELLLNGIVTQKLDYERHRLCEDRVPMKRTPLPRKTVLFCK